MWKWNYHQLMKSLNSSQFNTIIKGFLWIIFHPTILTYLNSYNTEHSQRTHNSFVISKSTEEWKLTIIENLCVCDLHLVTLSIWDLSSSQTYCEGTTKMSTVSCNVCVISSATASISTCNSWTVCRLVQHIQSLK